MSLLRSRETTNQDYLGRQEEFESNARTYPRRIPLAIDRAEGLYVTDVDGRRYVDCLGGAGTLVLGHNHPEVLAAIRRHLDEGSPLLTLDLTTPTKDRFVEDLFASLPPAFGSRAKVQFCGPSGADAVEAALKLVKTATGRRSILAFRGGYHGQTHGALALMGNLGPKAPISGLMPEVHFLPYPYPFRSPFGSDRDPLRCSDYLEDLLDDPESGVTPPAAVILEVVQGEGGCIPAPDDWLREIRRITRERHIPLIVDEIQTGWGRTGALYAIEHAGITPDVLILSKAIGGSLPLALILYHEDLDVWKPGAHSGTFRGNQLAMAAGRATLRHLVEHSIPAHAASIGRRLMGLLEAVRADHPCLGEVRGRGLMIGVEVVDPDRQDRWGRPRLDPSRASEIQRACFQRGLILELGGRHGSVLRLLPPLNLTEAQVDTVGNLFAEACAMAATGCEVVHV